MDADFLILTKLERIRDMLRDQGNMIMRIEKRLARRSRIEWRKTLSA